jgi:acyl carrier protein
MQFADLQSLMADVFEVPASEIKPNSTPDDIAAWDSGRLLELLLSIEKQYGVFVSPDRLPELMSVGAILAVVNGTEAAA